MRIRSPTAKAVEVFARLVVNVSDPVPMALEVLLVRPK
jgi:hypothetical protein